MRSAATGFMLHTTRIALTSFALSIASVACVAPAQDGTSSTSAEEGDDLEAASDELSTEGPTYEAGTDLVAAANLNLRAQAATDGDVLTVIPRGTHVKVTAASGANAWVSVSYDGQEGFAHTDYLLEREEGDEDPGNPSDVSCEGGTQTAYEGGRSLGSVKLMKIGNKVTTFKTGRAYLKLRDQMAAAGVTISINSGFRTMAEQTYFYNCYLHHSCNNGNLAAKPGYSNHQNGRALDLAISNQTKFKSELARLGLSGAWKRTVPSESWHWEYFGSDVGGVCQ